MPGSAQPGAGAAQPPPAPTTRPAPPGDGRPAPPGATAEERLTLFKQERLDNLARWKPPEGTDPEDVTEFRSDAAKLIDRFELKRGESADAAIAELQNQIGDRLNLFKREQQAEAIAEGREAQGKAQEARKKDFDDEKAEYEATRAALREAVEGFKPKLEGLTDPNDLQLTKKLLLQRIEGKQFNDDVPVAQQQQILANEVASDLKKWEAAEYTERMQARNAQLDNARTRSQDTTLPEAVRSDAAEEALRLAGQQTFASAFANARIQQLSTDAGLYGKETAAKIQATFSTDIDDTGDRLPPVTTPASADSSKAPDPAAAKQERTDPLPGEPATKVAADPAPESVPAGAATRRTALPDAIDNDTVAAPTAAPMAPAAAAAGGSSRAAAAPGSPAATANAAAFSTAPAAAAMAAAAMDDDPVAPGASGPWGWDGKPLPPEMADLRTFAGPATGTGFGPAAATDDDVLGVGAVRASIPGGGEPPRPTSPTPRAGATDEAVATTPAPGGGDGWPPIDGDHFGAPPPDVGPEPALPGAGADADAGARGGDVDDDRDDIMGF